MKKDNRTCIVCGKVYTYCPNCSSFERYPKWMNLFHDENCMKLFEIVSNYNVGASTKEKAFEQLQECDITDLENFPETVKAPIKEILIVQDIKNVKEASKIIEEAEDIMSSVDATEKASKKVFSKKKK